MNEILIFILTKTRIVRCTSDLVAIGIAAFAITTANYQALLVAAVLALLSSGITIIIEYLKDRETAKTQMLINRVSPPDTRTKVDGLAGPETRSAIIKTVAGKTESAA